MGTKIDLDGLQEKAIRNIINSARVMEAITTIKEFLPPEVETVQVEAAAQRMLPKPRKVRGRVTIQKNFPVRGRADAVLEVVEKAGRMLSVEEVVEGLKAIGKAEYRGTGTIDATVLQAFYSLGKKKRAKLIRKDRRTYLAPLGRTTASGSRT